MTNIRQISFPMICLLISFLSRSPCAKASSLEDLYVSSNKKKLELRAAPLPKALAETTDSIEIVIDEKKISIKGALFECTPYCAFGHFVESDDQLIFLNKFTTLNQVTFISAQSLEFQALFQKAQLNSDRDSLKSATNKPDQRSQDADFNEKQSESLFRIKPGLSLWLNAQATSQDSAFNSDSKTNPFLSYGLKLDWTRSTESFGEEEFLKIQIDQDTERKSTNGSENSVKWNSKSIEFGKFWKTEIMTPMILGPSVTISQRSRTFKNNSFQAISTEFQDVLFGLNIKISDHLLVRGTYSILSKINDVNAFRLSVNEYNFFQVGVEHCPDRFSYEKWKINFCGTMDFFSSKETTSLNPNYSTSQDAVTTANHQLRIGLTILYGEKRAK